MVLLESCTNLAHAVLQESCYNLARRRKIFLQDGACKNLAWVLEESCTILQLARILHSASHGIILNSLGRILYSLARIFQEFCTVLQESSMTLKEFLGKPVIMSYCHFGGTHIHAPG